MTTPPGPARPLLVCVGDLMVDVAVAAPTLRRGGDVVGSVRLGPGGSAANVAVWAREAGAGALVAARYGDDLAGRLLAAALAGAAAVFVSGYPLLRTETRAAALAAAAAAGQAAVPAAVDAASWPLVAAAAGEPVLQAAKLAGTLLANLDEAAALTGRRDPAPAAAQLAATVGTAVVKCGAHGVVVCAANGRPLTVTAEATQVADVTGAGDAFAAGYLVALADGAEPAEAARAGNRLAGRAVATVGAWPGPRTP